MPHFQNIADLVEQNGKTIRQNNQEQETIPVGSLVQLVNTFNQEEDGICLFVVNVGRDFDGEALYDLSFDKNAHKKLVEVEKQLEEKVWLNEPEEDQIFLRNVLIMRKYKAEGSIQNYRIGCTLKVIKMP